MPDGFLVPMKNIGSVNIVDVRNWDNTVTHDIARPQDDIAGNTTESNFAIRNLMTVGRTLKHKSAAP